MAAGLLILVGIAAVAAAARSGGSAQKRQTTGTALLKGGRKYRVELEVGGRAVNEAPNLSQVVDGVRNGLVMNGATDVFVAPLSPSQPIHASYTLAVQYDTPVVLGVAAQQMIGGLPADYVFRSVQQLS
jgi:hypothetical protein